MNPLSSRLKAFFERRKQRKAQRRATRAAAQGGSLDKRLVLRLSAKRVPTGKQLKHLPRYLSAKEKNAIKALTAVIVLALLAVGTKFASEHVRQVQASGGDYAEATVGGPHFVNPILASSNDADLDIVRLVFSGLMKTNENGELVPDIAASYEISEDGKTYVFQLREGVLWHDGAAFSASDVAATVQYIKNPAWESPLFAQFKNVSVEAVDERTVKFTLAEPFAPFPTMLTVGILPEHLWQDVKPENAARAELNIKPIGTGAFRFKSLAKDKRGVIRSYTLASNENSYDAKPYLGTLTFKFYTDFAAAAEALLQKRVDGLSFLPLEYRDDVEKLRTVKIYTLRLPQYTAVFFNPNKNAALKSKAVRQALSYAVDREKILRETLKDDAAPVHGPILPGFIGFHPDVKKYGFDAAQAAALLDQEGWKLNAEGVRAKELPGAQPKTTVSTPLAVTLTTVDTKENVAVAQAIKQNWEAIGVKTELEIVPSSKIQKDKIRTRDYGALLYGEIIGADPDPYPFWHSSQNDESGLNLAVFNHRRVDELLEKARTTVKTEERTAYYKEFQDILADEAPAIFLYSPMYTYVVSRKVNGIVAATVFTPADRFANVADWYVKTKRIWE